MRGEREKERQRGGLSFLVRLQLEALPVADLE
jgi:hypothetical protein